MVATLRSSLERYEKVKEEEEEKEEKEEEEEEEEEASTSHLVVKENSVEVCIPFYNEPVYNNVERSKLRDVSHRRNL